MSVLFDCLWWWRAEYAGIGANPYIQDGEQDATALEESSSMDANGQEMVQPVTAWAIPDADLLSYMSYDFTNLTDWDWAASLQFNDTNLVPM